MERYQWRKLQKRKAVAFAVGAIIAVIAPVLVVFL